MHTAFLQDNFISLHRKNKVENDALDFIASAGKVSNHHKHNYRAALIASLKEIADTEKLLVGKEELDKNVTDFAAETMNRIENFHKVLQGNNE